MKSFDVEDVMAALTEVPDNELVVWSYLFSFILYLP